MWSLAHVDYNMNNVKNVGDQSDQHYHMFMPSQICCYVIGGVVPKISRHFICRVKQSKKIAWIQ